MQPGFLKSAREDLARHVCSNALAPVALFAQQNEVLPRLVHPRDVGDARVANQRLRFGQVDAQPR